MQSVRWRAVAASATAVLCVATIASGGLSIATTAASRDARDELFVPLRAASPRGLSTLAANASSDFEYVWTQYETLIMSRARDSPLVLYFGSTTKDCEPPTLAADSDDDGDDDELLWFRDSAPVESASRECMDIQTQENALLVESLDMIANAYANLRIVSVPEELLDVMLRYHRVTTRPSLLWIPPRSSPNFQRYAHPETNFLDLSSREKLLEIFQQQTSNPQSGRRTAKSVSPATSKVDEREVSGETPSQQQQLGAIVSEFIRQWYRKSKLSPSMSSSKAAARHGSQGESSSSVVEFLPVLGVLAFVGFIVYDNHEIVLRTLQGRFVWFVWSLGVMYVAYSGIFHAVIHRMSLFYFHPSYGLVFFHPSGRRQFVLEGLLSGSWSFLISLAAFSIVEIMPMLRSKSGRSDMLGLPLLLIGIAYTILHFTFISKHPWLTK
ncbi:Oligosaccharyl transferase complex, subunit ost3/ost6, partial [Globisporangium splendens]